MADDDHGDLGEGEQNNAGVNLFPQEFYAAAAAVNHEDEAVLIEAPPNPVAIEPLENAFGIGNIPYHFQQGQGEAGAGNIAAQGGLPDDNHGDLGEGEQNNAGVNLFPQEFYAAAAAINHEDEAVLIEAPPNPVAIEPLENAFGVGNIAAHIQEGQGEAGAGNIAAQGGLPVWGPKGNRAMRRKKIWPRGWRLRVRETKGRWAYLLD